jgi:hypothetical protein
MPLLLEPFLFVDEFDVLLPFILDLALLFLKFFLFLNEFLSLSVEFLALPFGVADAFIIESNIFHFVLDIVAYFHGLLGLIFFQPSTHHVE